MPTPLPRDEPVDSRRNADSARFETIAELGRGGMAVVRLAVSHGFGGFSKLVVLKTILESFQGHTDTARMFLNEARVSARMNHSNVVQVYEVTQDSHGLPVIVMEYLDGLTLTEIISQADSHPDFSSRVGLGILCKVLAGLHYAHTLTDFDGTPLGIVHRDVTPHNVMVTYDGQVKLLDFGIAKLEISGEHTRTGIVRGKLGYMPPEQAQGMTVDHRADLFAAGVMLWEIIAQRRLWQKLKESDIMRQLLLEDIPRLGEVCPYTNPELLRISEKALAAAPEDRYQSAKEFQTDLEAYLETHGGLVPQSEVAALALDVGGEAREQKRAELDAKLAEVTSRLGEDDNLPSASQPQISPEGYSVDSSESTHRSTATAGAGLWTIGATLTLAVLGALLWLWSSGSTDPTRDSVTASKAAPTASAPSPSETETEVKVQIAVTPTNAQLFLDDQALQGNPYTSTRQRDQNPHTLRISAPGHVTLVRDVSLGADLTLALALEPEPSQSDSAEKPQPAAASPSPKSSKPDHKLKPRPGPRQAASAATPTQTPPPDCNPPYFIDDKGLKQFRRECFQR